MLRMSLGLLAVDYKMALHLRKVLDRGKFAVGQHVLTSDNRHAR